MIRPFINKALVPQDQLLYQPGNFVLIREKPDFISQCIEFGQRLRFRKSPYADYTHCALITNDRGDIIEALANGVKATSLSKYKSDSYTVVKIQASQEDRLEAVRFANSCIGDSYGWLTIISIAISLLTGLKFSFGFDGQEICSGLVAKALERTTAIFPRDASHLMPADLAQMYLAS